MESRLSVKRSESSTQTDFQNMHHLVAKENNERQTPRLYRDSSKYVLDKAYKFEVRGDRAIKTGLTRDYVIYRKPFDWYNNVNRSIILKDQEELLDHDSHRQLMARYQRSPRLSNYFEPNMASHRPLNNQITDNFSNETLNHPRISITPTTRIPNLPLTFDPRQQFRQYPDENGLFSTQENGRFAQRPQHISNIPDSFFPAGRQQFEPRMTHSHSNLDNLNANRPNAAKRLLFDVRSKWGRNKNINNPFLGLHGTNFSANHGALGY
jgi:hypothetical protein